MADGLKTFFWELLDPSPIKEKHVDLTMEQFEELTEMAEDMAELNEENLEALSDEAIAESDAAAIAQAKELNNLQVDKMLPEKYRHIDYHIQREWIPGISKGGWIDVNNQRIFTE